MARKFWLMKSEPDAYSIEDLERDGQAEWDGVRNYQVGDLVLFYHSNAKPPGVAGVAEVATEAYADPTQFDPESKYHDPKSTKEAPRWQLVDLAFVEKFDEVLGLDVLKEHAEALDGMMVIKRGIRFSVQPVDKAHFKTVLKLAGAKTKVR